MGTFAFSHAPSFQSLEVGVAHFSRTAASVSVVPACRPFAVEYPAAPLAFESIDVGVGSAARRARCGRIAAPAEGLWLKPALTEASGVGQDEDAFPTVGCADLGCAVTTPFRIEPERGQISDNSVEPSNNES